MRVAIVGSRGFTNEAQVRAFVRTLEPGTIVVSGGARGVDSWGADEARKQGLEVVEYLPDYKKDGRGAPLKRNHTIIEDSDRVVAFWDGESRGTAYSMRIAEEAGKPVEIHSCEEG